MDERAGLLLAECRDLYPRADFSGLVDVLAARSDADFTAAGVGDLAAVLSVVPDAALARPDGQHVLVRLARLSELDAPTVTRELIERADALVPAAGPIRRALDAERARELARTGYADDAVALLDGVISARAEGDALALGRAHLVRALTRLFLLNGEADGAVATDLRRAITLFGLQRAARWEAVARQALGFGVLYHEGAVDDALRELELAASLLPERTRLRGMLLTYLGDTLCYLGRLDEARAANAEAMTIGRLLVDDDLIAYAAWNDADVASWAGDLEAVHRARTLALAHPGSWFERSPAMDFFAAMAEALLRAGDVPAARRDLADAYRRADGTGYAARAGMARARLEGLHGDPVAGLQALDEIEALTPHRDHANRTALRALCLLAQGNESGGRTLLADARAQAARLALGDVFERREQDVLRRFESHAAPADVADTTTAPPTLRIVVLGGFAVLRDGAAITLPGGQASAIVKLVAVLGRVPLDRAIDVLWPELTDRAAGRAKLRNLLNRVRSSCGELILRDGEALVAAPGADVDLARLGEQVELALTGDPAIRVASARTALALARGELLPDDRHEDWTTAPRERLRRQMLVLLDAVIADASARGDNEDVVRLGSEAIDLEPFDLARYALVARSLVVLQRHGSAREIVRRGLSVADDLDVAPDPGLRRLAGELNLG